MATRTGTNQVDTLDPRGQGTTQMHMINSLIAGLLSASLLASPAAAVTRTGTPGNDQLAGTEAADTIDGKAGNDAIRGLGGNDRLLGGLGRDRVLGGLGNDFLNGGDGDDWLDGEAGSDIVSGKGGNDTLASSVKGNERLYGDEGNDQFLVSVSGRDFSTLAYGGPGHDRFGIGNSARGTFDGQDGDDYFDILEASLLTLTGGAGVDDFWFRIRGQQADATITDYQPGTDKLFFENHNSYGVLNGMVSERFDVNRDGVITPADGNAQTNVEPPASYQFVTSAQGRFLGARLMIDGVNLWLPGCARIDLRRPGEPF